MTIDALSDRSTQVLVGGLWVIEVSVRDDRGCLVDNAPVVVVTLPAGSTASPTVERQNLGIYRATHTPGIAGRYVAVATASGAGSVDFTVFAVAITGGSGMPTVDDLRAYPVEGTWTDDELQDALDAEAAAQRAVCRVGAVYPDDLRQALLRRVVRNLAMRKLPLIVPTGDGDYSPGFMPGRDPEVRRLEGPYRKVVLL